MNKNPYLQYKHAEGLGDIIACTLHSKLISPITYFLTGKKEMCVSCDKRRQALNFLFPIKFWKLFFSDYETKENDLDSYFKKDSNVIESEPILEEPETVIDDNDTNINSHILTGVESRVILPKNSIILRETEIEIDGMFFKTLIYRK
jgi:hypothetical protein